jgi:Zn-dependent protease/predicted transcriptional regulator
MAASLRLVRLIMGGTLRLLSVRGIPISIHASWLIIFALLTWMLAVGYFPETLPEQTRAAHWVSGLVAALLLFVSVLLHELSHSFVALAHGLSVRGITLHVFGGVSELADEPPSARAEFLIAAVGPLTSFAIAGGLWAAARFGAVPGGSPAAIVDYLVFFNVAVGAFNLIPGFPLDGGRVLRAVVWRWKGSLGQATEIASRVGGGFAIALMVLGVARVVNGDVIGGMWMTFIGMFLRSAATSSATLVATREALEGVPVRDVMTRDVRTIHATATLLDLAERLWDHHVTSLPVLDGDRVLGLVTVGHLKTVPRDGWRLARVGDLARPMTDELAVTPDDSVYRAYEKASRNGLGRLAVLDAGRLAGYLSIRDITHVLALRQAGAAPRNGRPLRRAA